MPSSGAGEGTAGSGMGGTGTEATDDATAGSGASSSRDDLGSAPGSTVGAGAGQGGAADDAANDSMGSGQSNADAADADDATSPDGPASGADADDSMTDDAVNDDGPSDDAIAPDDATSDDAAATTDDVSADDPNTDDATDEGTADDAGDDDGSSVLLGTPVEGSIAAVPTPRGEHGVGAINGEVYVLGGFTPSVTDSVQAYSPETDTWRDVADFPVVFHHPNVATVGDRMYVLGHHAGMGQRVGDGGTYGYDPIADEWTELTPMPPGTERGASCVTVFQDKVYIFGGTNDVALAEASTYDPATDSWEVLPFLPERRHHCIAAVYGEKIYIVSGRDVVITEVQTASYVYDPVAQTYAEVAPILTPRGGAAGGELGGRIYVFGGEGNTDDPMGIFHEAEVYDPEADSWEALPDMNVGRHGFGAAVIGDRMYMPGGSTAQGLAPQTTASVLYFEE